MRSGKELCKKVAMKFSMVFLWIVLLCGCSGATVLAQQEQESASSRIGEYIDIPNLRSKVLGNARNITVLLPPSYRTKPTQRFPVLYAQDGQNLFDVRTAFGQREWELDETTRRMNREGILPEIIIVGVWNTPKRMREYTPGIGGDRYLRFLVEELKPIIDSRLRTMPEAKHTAIMGSSMGGLISTWAALRRPDVFAQSASLSAAFQFMGEAIINELKAQKKPAGRHYFDIGTEEVQDRPERYVKYMSQMETILEDSGYRWGRDYVTYIEVGGQHNEAMWTKRVWRPLSFLFSHEK